MFSCLRRTRQTGRHSPSFIRCIGHFRIHVLSFPDVSRRWVSPRCSRCFATHNRFWRFSPRDERFWRFLSCGSPGKRGTVGTSDCHESIPGQKHGFRIRIEVLLPKASSWAPVRGAPPHIQDETPHAAFCGTGGAGTACFTVDGSTRGRSGFRWLNKVRK